MAAKLGAHLYVLGAVSGPCKIGWSEDPSRRARYVPNPPGSREVAHIAPVAYRYALYAERYAHWLLRDHHFRNEWFNVGLEVAIDAVNKAIALDFKRIGRIPSLVERKNLIRLSSEILERMDAVREEVEDRTDFVREAVERELKRRERRA